MGSQQTVANKILSGRVSLGIEFGSTRIKAILVDELGLVLATGAVSWESQLDDGIWTYSLEDVEIGLQRVVRKLKQNIRNDYSVELTSIAYAGVSGMMHGYLAFDSDDNLLTPFRTWRNAITGEASKKLSTAFCRNIPQRWSIAHYYQAILNGEEHVGRVAFLTTLAGYVHWRLTGKKILGIGDAAGMFPIDQKTMDYDSHCLDLFDQLTAESGLVNGVRDILPRVLVAGREAGSLTVEGARWLDPEGTIQSGTVFCPPEGDAGTGMVATNSVSPCSGNVSVGTSIFSMIVLEKPLKSVHQGVDIVATPDGSSVAMVHCNNGTGELDSWVALCSDLLKLVGSETPTGKLYDLILGSLFNEDVDDGILSFNYLSGEHNLGFKEGRPLYVRHPSVKLTLSNFFRAQMMSMFASLKLGMELLAEEGVKITHFKAHGGIFKTPIIAQRFLAAALSTKVIVGKDASEGGAWGIAILANFLHPSYKDMSLESYLSAIVFTEEEVDEVIPILTDVKRFDQFMMRYKNALPLEAEAIYRIH